MEWQVILALVLTIPVILFPAAFVWYLNSAALYAAVKKRRKGRVGTTGTEGLRAETPQPSETGHR